MLCYKCVEACGADAQNTFAIAVAGRGFDARISTELDVPLPDSACVYCGNCIGVCPTGALMFKHEFDLRQAGEWDEARQTQTDTICAYCGVGCTLTLHVQDDRIVKATSPLENAIDARAISASRAASASSSCRSGAGPANPRVPEFPESPDRADPARRDPPPEPFRRYSRMPLPPSARRSSAPGRLRSDAPGRFRRPLPLRLAAAHQPPADPESRAAPVFAPRLPAGEPLVRRPLLELVRLDHL